MDEDTIKRRRKALISGTTSLISGIVCIALASFRIHYYYSYLYWYIVLLIFGIICVLTAFFQFLWACILGRKTHNEYAQAASIIYPQNQVPVIDTSGQQQFGIPGIGANSPSGFANQHAAYSPGYQTNYWQPTGGGFPPSYAGVYQSQPVPYQQQLGVFPPHAGVFPPESSAQTQNFSPQQDGNISAESANLPPYKEPPPPYTASRQY